RTLGMQCKATSKQSGQRCKRNAAPGRSVCAMHGGKSPRGMESPNFKTGRYSKDAPSRLNARYVAGLEDPELCSLRDEIAMLDARTSELFKLVSISGAYQAIEDGRTEFAKIDALAVRGNVTADELRAHLMAIR